MSSSRRRPERRLSIAQGRDAREIQLPPSAGKCFLLTSPFIERMTTQEAFPLIRQMADALAAAHEVGVIHRDFKPSNVILVPTGASFGPGDESVRAVVTDFGLATTAAAAFASTPISPKSAITAPGHMVGTIAYMSP